MEIKQFGSFEEAQAFAKENNKKVYVFKKILSEKDEWNKQEEATGPFDYLKDYSLGVALLLEDYKKQKKFLKKPMRPM